MYKVIKRDGSRVLFDISKITKAITQAFKSDYGAVNAKYLEIGMPRNDIFFKNELIENTKNIIKKRYNIYENNKLILYAPTFRNDKFNNFFKY